MNAAEIGVFGVQKSGTSCPQVVPKMCSCPGQQDTTTYAALVLTSAYVKIFRTVTRNAVNKGV